MANKTSYLEKALLNSWLRALTTAVSGSNASTSNLLVTSSTGYNVGDIVQVSSLTTLHKITAIPDGTHVTVSPVTTSTVTTGNVVRFGFTPPAIYIGLFTAAPSDAGGGTEVSGSAYARQPVTQAEASWAAPSGSTSTAISGSNASTTNILVTSSAGFVVGAPVFITTATEISRHTVTVIPDGTHVTITPAAGAAPTTGTLDQPNFVTNASAITFPQSTGSWGTVGWVGFFDAVTTGNLLGWTALGTAMPVTVAGITPSFAIGALLWAED